GYEYKDIAVLMRLNALTRNFEEKFVAYDIPYKVFGGLKFFERAEIKNVMAYLKLLVNPQDEESFSRIINFPKRGIGDGAIEKLKLQGLGVGLFDSVMNINDEETGTLAKFLPFKNLMKDLEQKMDELSLFEFAKYVVDQTKILDEYSEKTDEDINRQMNIGALLQNIKNYEDDNPDKTLVDFLQMISLASDIDDYQESDNTVTLATVHSVKGLEFKVVFVVGLEEKYFPIIRTDSDEDEMEEERRLMYVAITRAKERLYLTCAKSRYMYGKQNFSTVSRFLKELGYENQTFKSDTDYQSNYSSYAPRTNFGGSLNSFMHKSASAPKSADYVVGDRVFHSKFGIGYVTFIDNVSKIIKIDFDNYGNKTLSTDFAPIKKI
ncbi:MAG: ATP-binding domain-containing protein, partial [Clostridia bacterium]|nr:ATP-binding domain-containing protein [Clostridia bacterium]